MSIHSYPACEGFVPGRAPRWAEGKPGAFLGCCSALLDVQPCCPCRSAPQRCCSALEIIPWPLGCTEPLAGDELLPPVQRWFGYPGGAFTGTGVLLSRANAVWCWNALSVKGFVFPRYSPSGLFPLCMRNIEKAAAWSCSPCFPVGHRMPLSYKPF